MRIVDYAVVASEKVSPSISKYTILGMLIGALISGMAIAVIEIMDNQIRSENYLLETYPDIPLLSVVPDMLSEKHHDNYYYYDQSSQGGKKAKQPKQPKQTEEPVRNRRSKSAKKADEEKRAARMRQTNKGGNV